MFIEMMERVKRKLIGRKPPKKSSRKSTSLRGERLEDRKMMTVTYGGGALLPHVETQSVYLGQDWRNMASVRAKTRQIDQFLDAVVGGSYMDMLTNAGYRVGRGTDDSGRILNVPLDKSSILTDGQIRQQLQASISDGTLTNPNPNELYIVYTEPGIEVQLSPGVNSANDFLGYHGAFAGIDRNGKGVDVHYALVVYPGSPNVTSGSQGFRSDFDQLTTVTSHELTEGATDPNVNYKAIGWHDGYAEIGDLAAGIYVSWNGFCVQAMVNKNDAFITPAGSTQYKYRYSDAAAQLMLANNVVHVNAAHSPQLCDYLWAFAN